MLEVIERLNAVQAGSEMEPRPEASRDYYSSCSSRYASLLPLALWHIMSCILIEGHRKGTGWIGTTDMGSILIDFVAYHGVDMEKVSIEKSTIGCMKVLDGLTIEDSGCFFNFEIPKFLSERSSIKLGIGRVALNRSDCPSLPSLTPCSALVP